MGWSFNCVDFGKDNFIQGLQEGFSAGYKSLACRVVGNHVWQLVSRPDGSKFISLDLIAKERNGGWGSKSMSEHAGPYYYDCPLTLLDKVSDTTDENALAWRAKVRSHHALKKEAKSAKASLKRGDVLTYGGNEYRLYGPHPFRKNSWHVTRTSDGHMFSMSNRQIHQALAKALA